MSGYHAYTFGQLLGEIVRRVTGQSLTEFVRGEIAGPLEADFGIGAQRADWPRCAEVIPPPPVGFDLSALDRGSVMVKTVSAPVTDPLAANTPSWRLAELGGVNGHGNARSVARMLSVLALGGAAGGVRLLSPDTIGQVFREQVHGPDLVLRACRCAGASGTPCPTQRRRPLHPAPDGPASGAAGAAR